MKRKSVVSLIAIVAIVTAVIFAGCMESYTKIRDIQGNVDEYANKKVTIVGTAGDVRSKKISWLPMAIGFMVYGKTGEMWVDCEDYKDNLPVSGNNVIVTGIVRHPEGRKPSIELESWKYLD